MVLWSHAVPYYLFMSNKGKDPYGVTRESKVIFWKATSSIPETK